MGVIGDREMADHIVALRRRDGVRMSLPATQMIERVAILAAQRRVGLAL